MIPCIDKEFCWWNTTLYIHVDNTKKLKFVRRKFNLENCSLCLKIEAEKKSSTKLLKSQKNFDHKKKSKLSFELTNITQKKREKRVYQLSFRSSFYAFKFEEAWKRKIKIIYKWYVSVQISYILPPTKIAIIFVVIWWNVVFLSVSFSLYSSNWTNVGTFWYLCNSLCWFFYFAILSSFFFFLLSLLVAAKKRPKVNQQCCVVLPSLFRKSTFI